MEDFCPRFIFALFTLWPISEFKSGWTDLYIHVMDYVTKYETLQVSEFKTGQIGLTPVKVKIWPRRFEALYSISDTL